jgi:large conductance mechanosensitive channel
MKKLMDDFKSFALKGNVIDMAVGIIIGGAFGKIIASLVGDIIMPFFSLVTGKMDIVNLKYVVVNATAATATTPAIPESAIRFGVFLQTIIDFLIIAFSIFMVIKAFSKFKRKQVEKAPAVAAPNAQEVLLTEIRDLLKNK